MSDIPVSTPAAVAGGRRLDPDAALQLARQNDLQRLGALAARANQQRNGDRVLFNRNRHINYTNLCVHACRFCAFRRDAGQEGAFCLTPKEVGMRAAEAAAAGAREVHLVGGLHPRRAFDYYLDLLRSIRQAAPKIHIKAYTAVEVDYLARLSGLALPDLLAKLRRAGLDSLPGGGAEIFAPAVRQRLCPEKISGRRWLEVMEAAHAAGLSSTATMLFGHLESWADRIDHLRQLRQLQDRTGGFKAFVALPYQPANTRLPGLRGPGGVEILKTLAVSRLFLDNFDHIKGYWVMLGVALAQVSLAFGVNDLDGTVTEERIGHAAGAGSPQVLSCGDLCRLIRSAGKVPVERDSLYRLVREQGSC